MAIDANDNDKMRMYNYLKYEFMKNGVDTSDQQKMTNYVRANANTRIQIEHIQNKTYTGKLNLDKPIRDIDQAEDPPDVPSPEEFRETGHGSRNIFDMGNTESNADVTNQINALVDRNKHEDIKDEQFENGVLHLKMKSNLEALAKKGVGISLGTAYADSRGFLREEQMTEYLTSQKDLSDILSSFADRYNKSETLSNYTRRIQTDEYYEKWITERDNLSTNLDFDSYKQSQLSGVFQKTVDVLSKGLTYGYRFYQTVAVMKTLGSIIRNSIVKTFLSTSLNAYKSVL